MIQKALAKDFDIILAVINESAMKYKGVIPPALYREPFLSKEYLTAEIEDGVRFYLFKEDQAVLGVMGVQDKDDVMLIRHSYVSSCHQRKGIGSKLLRYHMKSCELPLLVGCLKAMTWAIAFYESHGFTLLSEEERDRLRAKYWRLPAEHVAQSVVLACPKPKTAPAH